MTPRDQVLWILAGGMVFYTAIVLLVALLLPANQAVYALFSGILGGFSGGLLVYLRVKPPDPPPPANAG